MAIPLNSANALGTCSRLTRGWIALKNAALSLSALPPLVNAANPFVRMAGVNLIAVLVVCLFILKPFYKVPTSVGTKRRDGAPYRIGLFAETM